MGPLVLGRKAQKEFSCRPKVGGFFVLTICYPYSTFDFYNIMNKFRAKQHKILHEVWFLEERFCFFFWLAVKSGSELEMKNRAAELNNLC